MSHNRTLLCSSLKSKLGSEITLQVYRNLIRPLSTTSVKNQQPPSLIKLKKLQADFQCEDGTPVFLKGGFCDRIIFSTTLAMCLVGISMCVLVVYENAKPESWKKSQAC